jgi:hypothetical protein
MPWWIARLAAPESVCRDVCWLRYAIGHTATALFLFQLPVLMYSSAVMEAPMLMCAMAVPGAYRSGVLPLSTWRTL